jgi:hypothetical protein
MTDIQSKRPFRALRPGGLHETGLRRFALRVARPGPSSGVHELRINLIACVGLSILSIGLFVLALFVL